MANGDGKKLIITRFDVRSTNVAEAALQQFSDELDQLTANARAAGATSHRFAVDRRYSQLVSIDEWPSEEAFQEFFDGNEQIQAVMAEAGVQGKPQIEVLDLIESSGSFQD